MPTQRWWLASKNNNLLNVKQLLVRKNDHSVTVSRKSPLESLCTLESLQLHSNRQLLSLQKLVRLQSKIFTKNLSRRFLRNIQLLGQLLCRVCLRHRVSLDHSSSMLNIPLASSSLLSTSSWAVFIALRFFKAFYSLPYGRLMYTKKSTNLTFLNTALMHSDNSWSKFFHAC